MKQRLILLLDHYPYSSGEYSFIKSELKCLTEKFDVSILCATREEEQRMPLDPQIGLYHVDLRYGSGQILLSVLGMLFTRIGLEELSSIVKIGEKIFGRIMFSTRFFCYARLISKYARRNILKDKDEKILIYSFWFNHSCLGFLMNKDRYQNMKVISRVHGHDLYDERNEYGRQPFRKQMDRMVDKLFFIAESGKEYYINSLKTDDDHDKYHIARLGTESPLINVAERPREAFTLISCSSCIPLKRIDLIIKALSLIDDDSLKPEGLRWIHFGDGELFRDLQELAEGSLSLKERISYEFRGHTSLEDILKYYSGCDKAGFITTSETEGSPVSIQEALSYGMPIIGTSVGEIPYMIEGNGYLLSEDPDVSEVKNAILSLYKDSFDDGRFDEMKKNSYKLWKEYYNGPQNAIRFTDILTDIMHRDSEDR